MFGWYQERVMLDYLEKRSNLTAIDLMSISLALINFKHFYQCHWLDWNIREIICWLVIRDKESEEYISEGYV